jgi:dTDP-4-dehydrorhamnose reductase
LKSTTTSHNENQKILVLGHRGLLGKQVSSYLKAHGKFVVTTNLRWPEFEFLEFVKKFEGIIVNCAGSIPQSGSEDYSINYELPLFMLKNGKSVVQPDTDCVFSGKIDFDKSYEKTCLMDATGPYAESKIKFNIESENYNDTLRIIRTSIIGFDSSNKSLLSWFLNTADNAGECSGYTNHLWNGITTLQWSKISKRVIDDWYGFERLTQIGSNRVTKYELLLLFSSIFEKPCSINPVSTEERINKCLKSDTEMPNLETQIRELKLWRSKIK